MPFTVVARSEDGSVEVVSGVGSGQVVELISMWVAPSQRGTGLAGRLTDEVVAWAVAQGRQTCLMVRDDNVGAVRAYARANVVIDHGVPGDWPADAPPEHRVCHGADTSPEA